MRPPALILMVEDNPGDVRLALEALKNSQMETRVWVAFDGVEAIELLQVKRATSEEQPDLILLDLNLPRKNGREVLRHIKSDPVLKCIPVVVLTSSQAEEDIACCYRLHANCCISKPLELEELIKVIGEVLHFWLTTVTVPREHFRTGFEE